MISISEFGIDEVFPFSSYRPFQREIITKILNEHYNEKCRYFCLESPTGSGKSVIGYTVGKFMINKNTAIDKSVDRKPRIIICTKTRQLQKQYGESFGNNLNVSVLWSSVNYACNIDPGSSDIYFGSPECLNESCPAFDSCNYLKAKSKFLKSDVGILNYHYYMFSKILSPEILILDEAHTLETLLCNMLTVNIDSYELLQIINRLKECGLNGDATGFENIEYLTEEFIRKIKDVNSPETKLSIEKLIGLLDNVSSGIKLEMDPLRVELTERYIDTKKIDKKLKKEIGRYSKVYKSVVNLTLKLKEFHESKVKWIISNRKTRDESEYESIEFKPLHIIEMTPTLFRNSKFALLMSATICGCEQFGREMGFPENEYRFASMPSFIDKRKRRILAMNVAKVNKYNNEEALIKITRYMDHMIGNLERAKGACRGIIHSVSYKNAELIKSNSKLSDRMIIPRGDDLLMIRTLLEKNKNTIVVSPSIIEGVDLKGDLSRFQIFPKVPYLFLGDIWIKEKMNDNPKWYNRNTIIKIVQGAGRSVRGDDDWAYTFIMDSNFDRLLKSNLELFPTWFKDAISRISN